MDWSTLISALSTIICAIIAGVFSRECKSRVKADAEAEKQAKIRASEAKLQLQMLNSNTMLCIGMAQAIKNGHCNGELEAGLKAVKEADLQYKLFLEGLALESIQKG